MADTNSSGNQKPTLSWSQPAQSGNNAAKPANNAAPSANKLVHNRAADTSSSNAGVYVGIFVAGLIVGALIGWGISASHQTAPVAPTSTTASSTSETSSDNTGITKESTSSPGSAADLSGSIVGSSGNVTIASPQTAGFAVAVSKVSVSAPTWLVVYEDHAGVPGNAIGAGLFFQGETSGTIQLLRATLPGQSYLVGQSLDDGNKVFSLQTDKPVRDSEGNPLFTEFSAK